MTKVSKTASGIIAHASGDNVSHAKLCWQGGTANKSGSAFITDPEEKLKFIQECKIKQRESIMVMSNNPDVTAEDRIVLENYLTLLEQSDWSSIEGFRAFLVMDNQYSGFNQELKIKGEGPKIRNN